MKMAFEQAMGIEPHRAQLNEYGGYTDPETKVLWLAFNAGMSHSPDRGQYVVAELVAGRPVFDSAPDVLEYKDRAKSQARDRAMARGTVHVVYKQIIVFDPHKYSKRSA